MTETAPLLPSVGEAFGGKVMGGQQPVSGAVMAVVATGTAYGTAGTTLATTTTDANGNWSFPAGSYTCPTASTPMLITARGGNPGLAPGTNNTAIYLVAYAGPCGQLTPSTFFIVNEVTTVAAATVLRAFMNTSTTAGYNPTNAVGFPASNASAPAITWATYQRLVSNRRGASPGDNLPAGMVIPTERINSLANTLAACVNTTSVSSTACSQLLSYSGTPTSGGVANTWVATANIAYSTAAYVTQLFNLGSGVAPFQPTLTTAPGDYSLIITHTGGNLNSPSVGVDIDPSNNVWVATKGGFAGAVDVISYDGTMLKSGILNGIVDGISSISTDTFGNAMVTGNASQDAGIYRISSGFQLSCQNVNQNVVKNPKASVFVSLPVFDVTVDPYAFAVSDTTRNAVYTVNSSCEATLTTTTAPTYLGASPNYLWISSGTSLVRRYTGFSLNPVADTTSSLSDSGPLLFDQTNWYQVGTTPDVNGKYTIRYGALSSATSTSSYTTSTKTVAGEIDGMGNMWLANAADGAANAVYSSGYKQGYTDMASAQYNGLVIDGAGNVWVTRNATGGLLQIVGVAEPTVVPMSKNAMSNTWGKRP